MSNPYRQMELQTASPVQLVVRLYEGALRHLREAQAHHEASRVKDRSESLSRGLAIVSELRSSLDMERGGEVARNLDALYDFAIERLIQTNLRSDAAGLDEVIPIFEELHGAWSELARRPPEDAGETGP